MVLEFFGRNDNSQMMPGKKDAKIIEKGTPKIQKRILNDYLSNLYDKSVAEYPEDRLSFTSFCRMRPSNYLLANFTTRIVCLCTRHQNMALKLKSLKLLKIVDTQNPDVFVKQNTDADVDALIRKITETGEDKIVYDILKKVKVQTGNGVKEKMKLVREEENKDVFVEIFKNEVAEFRAYVNRIKNQYTQLRQLKDHLPDDDIIMQMDFAKDYHCRSQQEVQSAYWNPEQVTIHPMVFYYKKESSLLHKSIVAMSDEPKHDAGTVFAILKKVIPFIKSEVGAFNQIHYWTDSPMSQYRNKTIFNVVSRHEETFGAKAVWNYFEAGHGKGPCDGIGGTSKRLADEAVKQEKVSIQDASDFMKWAEENQLGSAIKFLFVDKKNAAESRAFLMAQSENLKPVKGTMKTHSVFSPAVNEIWAREVSCYCLNCFDKTFQLLFLCEGWKEHCLSREAVSRATKIKALPAAQLQSQPDARRNKDTDAKESVSLKEEDFVAAVYSEDCQVYIGKVLEVDEDDILISFMHHGNSNPLDSNSVLKWPDSDEVWINRDDVLCLIPEPVSLKITGSREGCKLRDGVFTNVLSLYRKWKKAKSSKK